MAENSKIEWTDATWNPLRATRKGSGKAGWHCVHASPGCANCYAESMNAWRGTGLPYTAQATNEVEVFLDDGALALPLRWKRPRRVFVCSMTDLFADFVPDSYIDQVFAVMALAPQHTFQVLTKRAGRMRAYVTGDFGGASGQRLPDVRRRQIEMQAGEVARELGRDPDVALTRAYEALHDGPLRNVWLGVSIEDQRRADERVPELLATPAAVRFVSCEPLLAPVTLDVLGETGWARLDALRGLDIHDRTESTDARLIDLSGRLNWVICGGESGPGARPMHPDWARGLRDQCAAAWVPFFFKQWGAWAPADERWPMPAPGDPYGEFDRGVFRTGLITDGGGLWRVGKQAAGRHLDGVLHDEMPA